MTAPTTRQKGVLDTTGRRMPEDLESTDTQALTVLFSPDTSVEGRSEALPRRRFEIGRTPTLPGLALGDGLVSRVHASVGWDVDRERYLLRDEGSRNGSSVNGEEVEWELLAPGDLVRVGDTLLRFGQLDVNVVGWEPASGCLLKGRSLGLRRVLDQAGRVARSNIPVLVLGDTGTGKELVARELHRLSRRVGPFVALNCAALPDALVESELFGHRKGAFSGAAGDQMGLLRAANGGTLLLDEVGELPPGLQAKLLRVLDDKQVRPVGSTVSHLVDVRFLAATNCDLADLARSGGFRSDLYARLAGWTIQIPPLRERPDDVLPIVRHVLSEEAGDRAYEITGDFFEALVLHDWPFNARELVAVVRAAIVMQPEGGRLGLEHLPRGLRPHRADCPSAPAQPAPTDALPPKDHVPSCREMRRLLEHYKGNISHIADHTGRERAQVYRWLRRYGLKPDAFRRRDDDV